MDKRLPRKPRWRGAPAWLEMLRGFLSGKTGAAGMVESLVRLGEPIQNRFQAIEHVNERLIQNTTEVL